MAETYNQYCKATLKLTYALRTLEASCIKCIVVLGEACTFVYYILPVFVHLLY